MKVINRADGTLSIFSDDERLAIEISLGDDDHRFGVIVRATGIGDTLDATLAHTSTHYSRMLYGSVVPR